jgi:hypothetical protein
VFDVVFSAPVSGFDGTKVDFSASTAGVTGYTVTDLGDATAFRVEVTSVADNGTVVATIPEGVVTSVEGSVSNQASTSVDNSVTYFVAVSGEGQNEGEGEGGYSGRVHSADINGDGRIGLSELLRVIQLYNSGGYHCAAGTEDGYAPGLAGDESCIAHDSDYAPQDWQIGLSELLRVIQFFNSAGYHACPDTSPATEDGFCVGK